MNTLLVLLVKHLLSLKNITISAHILDMPSASSVSTPMNPPSSVGCSGVLKERLTLANDRGPVEGSLCLTVNQIRLGFYIGSRSGPECLTHLLLISSKCVCMRMYVREQACKWVWVCDILEGFLSQVRYMNCVLNPNAKVF